MAHIDMGMIKALGVGAYVTEGAMFVCPYTREPIDGDMLEDMAEAYPTVPAEMMDMMEMVN